MRTSNYKPKRRTAPRHESATRQMPRTHRSAPKARPSVTDDAQISLGPVDISRRQFLMGTAGIVAAAALIGGGVAMTSDGSGKAEASQGALTVPEDKVFTTEQCEYLEDTNRAVTLRTRASLPYGTTLTCCSDSVAACLVPTETADPLLKVGLLHLGSGNMTDALTNAVGSDEGFQILDARAHGGGMIWIETNMTSGAWRIYTTTLNGAAVGDPVKAFEADATRTLPTLAVSDGFAWWQTSPKDSSSKESSCIWRVPFGGNEDAAQMAHEAAAFACGLSPAGVGVASCAKVGQTGNTWQLIYLTDDADAENCMQDSLTLPSTMKPMDVSYGPNGFGFALDSIYSFGDGISNLGTYVPESEIPLTFAQAESDALAKMEEEIAESSGASAGELTDADRAKAAQMAEDAVCELYSAAEWFRFPRAPISAPAFSGNWVFVKSTNVVAAVDIANRKYVSIPTESATQGYGEYLASAGTANRMVTFANVDYTPMSAERIHECTVRVWEPLVI
ncbi:MAG: hypothetical protein HFJ65_05810 [Eggerthellaceae bacterium]|nr:hypothetical protein [Eggerthellaceae bacterium]